MRIAVFVDRFPAVSETFILNQITGLLDLGHDVHIYAQSRPDPDAPLHKTVQDYGLGRRTTYIDIPPESGYWELPAYPVLTRTWIPGTAESIPNTLRLARAAPKILRCLLTAPRVTCDVLRPSRYGYQASSLSSLYRLAALRAAPDNYDVVHAHFGPVGDNFRLAARLWRVPFVVSFHGYDVSMWPQGHGRAVYEALFAAVDVTTVNSAYAADKVIALGCAAQKVRTLHYGVNPDDFRYRPRLPARGDTVRLLTVGRLVEKKGLEYTIRAVAEVRSRHPDIHYDIIGEGPLRPLLEALVGALGLSSVVTLHGAKPESVVRDMMDRAHVFLLCSVTAGDGDEEGTPVSLMEAQACGLPVISSWHSGIAEIVADGESGFLCEPRDVSGIAARLASLLDNPGSWPDIGRRGRNRMCREFNLAAVNRELAQMYEGLVARHVRAHEA